MASPTPPVQAPIDALEVAKCFIELANDKVVDVPEEGDKFPEGITNLKLQKMLYFAQAAHLALYGKPLFKDKIYAWKFGPVIKDVYHAFKKFGNEPIPSPEGFKCNSELKSFLNEVWQIFGKYTAFELVNISHNLGPWKHMFKEGEDVVIDNDAIESFYKQLFVRKGT